MNEPPLTEEQSAILAHPGNLVVVARPGSGKTRVLSAKVRAILPTLADYQGVIAISYTNKASDELKLRSRRDAIDIKSSFFGTIDRFCDAEVIIPFLSHLFGWPQCDSSQITIRRIRDLPDEEQKQLQFAATDQGIHRISAAALVRNLELIKHHWLQGVLLLDANGALALYVLQNSQACRRFLKARYSHVLIDEYQDSGQEQHEILLELSQMGLTAIAVGDLDQSIFGFSGRSSRYLQDLTRRTGFRVFPLTLNHRCHASIVNYSMRLITPNSSMLPADEMRVFLKAVQGTQSAVARWIEAAIPSAVQRFGVSRNADIGVLVRSNESGKTVDCAMAVKHRFFRATALEDDFSLWGDLFCRLLYLRFSRSGTVEEIIQDLAGNTLATAQLRAARRQLVDARSCPATDLRDHMVQCAQSLLPHAENTRSVELLNETLTDEGSLASFRPAGADEVQIMTLHKAKGLEFDIVFHLDLYEWVMPAKGPGPGNDWDSPVYKDLSQDLNLHYVGVTRARKACVLCASTQRVNASGQVKQGAPSEFLWRNGVGGLREELG